MQEITSAMRAIWHKKQTQRWVVPLVIFVLALLPRTLHPISRPMHWYSRSVRFGDAVLRGDWAGTFQRHHPGVTTMWLSGAGLKVFAALRGLSSAQLLDVAPVKPGVIAEAVNAGVLPLALVIALCILLSYTLVKRLSGPRVAFVAGCLLSLDPFYIARSQVLHVDALMATFMLVSALFLLNHLHSERKTQDSKHDLLLSGAFGGLALLTKSPALFLVPYAGLVVGIHKLIISAIDNGWRNRLWDVSRIVLLWMLIAALTFIAIWPAIWVQPVAIAREMFHNISAKFEKPHENPVFFNGKATFENPGSIFYLATIGWKTTLVTLPMFVLGILIAAARARRSQRDGLVVLSLLAYALFFTAQMCLGARKEMRYLSTVFPALDVLAAFGVVWTADVIAGADRKRRLQPLLIGSLVLLQAGLVLPRHPYYGTLHNRLLGGSRTAQHILPLQDQGEGLDLAAKYLNTLPRAQRASASIHTRGSLIFKQHFIGLTNIAYDPRANYRVYFVNQVMRQLDIEAWEALWEADRQTEPLWTVAFGDVPYVWVYGEPPEKPAADGVTHDVAYRLGEHIQLKRFRLSAEVLTPGDTLTVVPIWSSDGKIERSYKTFCHILSEDGKLVAQRDGIPLNGVRHTPSWRAGEVIEDSYRIPLDSDLPAGSYELSIGMYDIENLARLPVYDTDGERVPGDRIILSSLRVESPVKTGE